MERRFQPIQVDQPSADESIQILKGLRDRYEAHHRVSITDDAIEVAVKLSDRYISDRFLPDKAIDLIDEAGSKVRLRSFTTPPNLKELEQKLDEVRKEKDAAVQSQEFEKRLPCVILAAPARASRGYEEIMEREARTGKLRGYC